MRRPWPIAWRACPWRSRGCSAAARRKALPPADYLHRYYARTYWRLPLGPLKAIAAAIAWPVALVIAVIIFTRRNGRAIAERSGVSVPAQVLGQVEMAARHAIAPFWYYMFELHLPERKKQAALYLTAHETIGPAYSLLQPPERR